MAEFIGPDHRPDTYELIDRPIASGGEGSLWKAVEHIDGEPTATVALKVMHASAAGDIGVWWERWDRQRQVLSSLNHPGVVHVKEVFPAAPPHPRRRRASGGRTLCLVMEWVQGITAEEWVGAGEPGFDERIDVICQIAEAVAYLHAGDDHPPVIHRDIKPANVLLTVRNGRAQAVLVDFGFSRLDGSHSNTIVETRGYLAPEAVVDGYSPATDRFAVGVTAFVLLTGALPTHRLDLDRQSLLGAGSVAAGHARVADLVLALIDRRPELRPELGQWAKDLRAAAEPAARLGPSLPSRSRPVRFAAVAALVVACLAAAAWRFGSTGYGPSLRGSGADVATTGERAIGATTSSAASTTTTTTAAPVTTTATPTTSTTVEGGTRPSFAPATIPAGAGTGSGIIATRVAVSPLPAGGYVGTGRFGSRPSVTILAFLSGPLDPSTSPSYGPPRLRLYISDVGQPSQQCGFYGSYDGTAKGRGYEFTVPDCFHLQEAESVYLSGPATAPHLRLDWATLSGQIDLRPLADRPLGLGAIESGTYVGTAEVQGHGSLPVAMSLIGRLSPSPTSSDDIFSKFVVDFSGWQGPDGSCQVSGVLLAASEAHGYEFLPDNLCDITGTSFLAWIGGTSEALTLTFVPTRPGIAPFTAHLRPG